jgi:hypothetical protein
MRLVAAALSGMATAAHTSLNARRGPGEAAPLAKRCPRQ